MNDARPSPAAANPRSDLARGLFWGVLGVIMFGLTLPATRLAVLELDPIAVTFGRALVAAGLGAIALRWAGRPPPLRRDWPRLAAFACCVTFGFPLLMGIAMRHAPAAHGGIVLAVLPLLTAIASVLVAGERPSLGFWICGTLGTAAVAAYALLASAGAADLHWADILLAGAAVSAAVGYALGGDLSRRLGGWEVISWGLVAVAPLIAVLFVVLRVPINWSASWGAWAGFAYVAVISQFVGFFAWNKGLALGGIAKVGQTQLLQTFVTLIGAAVILQEPVGLREVVFAVVVGVIVAAGARMRVRRAEAGN
jgi:drug/metabolite transporter (DMT)-like permease